MNKDEAREAAVNETARLMVRDSTRGSRKQILEALYDAGAASVDRRAIVDLLRGWLDWFNGPYTEGCDYINPPLTKTNAVLAEMEANNENS